MSPLDQLIENAIKSEGKQEDVNKVYLALLKANLFIPIQKRQEETAPNDDSFSPLFAKIEDNYFMAVFETHERLTAWAGEHYEVIEYIELSGREVIAGINDDVYLCLNVGSPFYKEFSPDEVKQLKRVVSKIEQLKG